MNLNNLPIEPNDASVSIGNRVPLLLNLRLILLLNLFLLPALGFSQNVTLTSTELKLTHFNTPMIGSQMSVVDKKFGATQPLYSLLHTSQVNLNCGLKVQPFFCRIESQIERKSGLAPRFRLGSLDYTNWLEGKTQWKE